MNSGGAARHAQPLPLGQLLTAGIVDSTGLAFGWTVFLLVINDRGGLHEASLLAAAMLIGIALSAPFSGWLSPRLSPRDLLRGLAAGEGACRLGLFGLLWLNPGPWLMAPVIVVMNVLAWSAFAAMRSEASRSEQSDNRGRSLTWYATAIAGSEALAAGAASLLLIRTPPTPVMVAVAVVYVLSLTPQWWVGAHADSARPVPHTMPGAGRLRALLVPCGLGAGVFLLAAGPALLATVLAFEWYGSPGVLVSAVCFATGSLGSARLQAVVGRWRPSALAVFALGAVLVGGWSLSGRGLLGLAIAQACAGLAQCTLEGDLDHRIVGRLNDEAATTGLAFASSSRALGGALAVVLLPILLNHTSVATVCGLSAAVLLLAAMGVGGYTLGRISVLFLIGFAAGRGIGAVQKLPRIQMVPRVQVFFVLGFLFGVPLRVVDRFARRSSLTEFAEAAGSGVQAMPSPRPESSPAPTVLSGSARPAAGPGGT